METTDHGCKYCNESEEFEQGCITGKIKKGKMGFEYSAYSIDSSFDYHDSEAEINFCPFCGVKLCGGLDAAE